MVDIKEEIEITLDTEAVIEIVKEFLEEKRDYKVSEVIPQTTATCDYYDNFTGYRFKGMKVKVTRK